MGELSASRQQATWLGRIPLPALILADDGSAVAVNEGWADLSPFAADGYGWLEAVEPEFRSALRATLLLAAATSEPGSADCPVTGSRGARRSRWWWQPFPPGGLVVCVAVINDGLAAGFRPVAGDAHEPLSQERTGAALTGEISAELALAAAQRIFEAGLALEAAASLLSWPAATVVLRVLDDLDQLVRDIRNAALEPPDPPTTPRPHEQELCSKHTVISAVTDCSPGISRLLGSWTGFRQRNAIPAGHSRVQ